MRARLLTLVLIALTVGAVAFAARGSVRFGEPPPYHELVFTPISGQVTIWHVGAPTVGGWAQNNLFTVCPSAVVWITTGRRQGFIGIGPLPPGQRVLWAGELVDIHLQVVPVTTKPEPVFNCDQ